MLFGDKMEISINGKFCVEIRDKNANVIKKIETPNMIVDGGLKQIARWLNRDEYVNNPVYNARWKNVKYCFGEARSIVVNSDGTTITSTTDNDPQFMLDGNELSCAKTDWQTNNARVRTLKFPESIHLKGFAFYADVGRSWSGYYDQWQNSSLKVKTEGITVDGAGTTACNSNNYKRIMNLRNGMQVYKKYNESYYVFVNDGKTEWHLSTSLGGSPIYKTTNVVLVEKPCLGTWTNVGCSGASPVPSFIDGVVPYQYPVYPKSNFEPNEEDRLFSSFIGQDWEYTSNDVNAANSYGLAPFNTVTFENIEELFSGGGVYGYIPYVTEIVFTDAVYASTYYGQHRNYIYELVILEALPHPQNPYALKLGTGDTITTENMVGLNSVVSSAAWKVDTVEKNGFTVSYKKVLGLDEANGVLFKEIGLFGNFDGHLPHKLTEPKLENAENLFARALFSEPWEKTADQTALIYYEITVG